MTQRTIIWGMALLGLLTLVVTITAFAHDHSGLTGEYEVRGWGPGKDQSGPPDYRGHATLIRRGDGWRYRGFMDDQIYAGAGLYDPDGRTLSLSFVNGDGVERGVTVLKVDGDVLKGRWVMDVGGDGTAGFEVWVKHK